MPFQNVRPVWCWCPAPERLPGCPNAGNNRRLPQKGACGKITERSRNGARRHRGALQPRKCTCPDQPATPPCCVARTPRGPSRLGCPRKVQYNWRPPQKVACETTPPFANGARWGVAAARTFPGCHATSPNARAQCSVGVGHASRPPGCANATAPAICSPIWGRGGAHVVLCGSAAREGRLCKCQTWAGCWQLARGCRASPAGPG